MSGGGATETPDAPQVARPRRLEFLDGIRALAALYVVCHHTWLTTYVSYPKNVGPSALSWLVYGQLSVSVFIVVSGFSLALATVKSGDQLVGGTRRFIRRRAWRILPAYWAALIFSVLVLATLVHAKTGETASLKAILVHGALLQDIIGSTTPNGAFWSIAIEWQIYFLFPLLLLLVRWWGGLRAALATTALVIATYLLATNVHAFSKLLHLTPQFLALFVFGMFAARVTVGSTNRWQTLPWGVFAAVSSIVMLVVINQVGSVTIVRQFFWVDLGVGIAVACTIAALASGRAPWLRAPLESRALVFIGSFSFSIYLIHVPILRVVWLYIVEPRHLSLNASFAMLLLIALPLVLVVSYGFHLVCERPFMRHRSLSALTASRKSTRSDQAEGLRPSA